MKRYSIVYSAEAIEDIECIKNAIKKKYQAPITAKKYVLGLQHEIELLYHYPNSYPACSNRLLLIYGQNTKRINYKKIAIIFGIFGEIVYIHRVLPASIMK
jgi:hypothetical protein